GAVRRDGKLGGTGGEDRAIYVWDPATGKQVVVQPGAHRVSVTSLQFAGNDKLVSAGRDKRLVVWELEDKEGKKELKQTAQVERRSGDGPMLSVSPNGRYVTFDEGREVRVLSLDDRKIVYTIQNPPGTVNFATMALFSPDGRTVLTNGAAPGRLQLWRASGVEGR